GLILAVIAVQLIAGRREPVVPAFVLARRVPTKRLLRLGYRAIHILKYVEKAVHPRWPMAFEVEKRAVGFASFSHSAFARDAPAAPTNLTAWRPAGASTPSSAGEGRPAL